MRCSRLLALALAFCLLWGLAACAKTGEGPNLQCEGGEFGKGVLCKDRSGRPG